MGGRYQNLTGAVSCINTTTSKTKQQSKIEIFDMFGKLVLRKELGILPAGINNVKLNVSGLINGSYAVILTKETSIETIKINILK